ncbi:MAG: hypothetical protein WA941_10030 [Nitrososphaeraceae archaeon]
MSTIQAELMLIVEKEINEKLGEPRQTGIEIGEGISIRPRV